MNAKAPQCKPEGMKPAGSPPPPPPKNANSDPLAKFEFKCTQCGRCCGLVPFTRADYKQVRRKAEKLHVSFVKQNIEGHVTYLVKGIIEKIQKAGSIEKVNAKDIICPFLESKEEKKTSCKIYDDRPMICRMFGNEGWRGPTLCCPYQNIGKIQEDKDA